MCRLRACAALWGEGKEIKNKKRKKERELKKRCFPLPNPNPKPFVDTKLCVCCHRHHHHPTRHTGTPRPRIHKRVQRAVARQDASGHSLRQWHVPAGNQLSTLRRSAVRMDHRRPCTRRDPFHAVGDYRGTACGADQASQLYRLVQVSGQSPHRLLVLRRLRF